MSDEIIDQPLEDKKEREHSFILSRNKVELKGIFAWLFYLNLTIWFLDGLLKLTIDLINYFK